MLPLPGALTTSIVPPSRRAISRLIVRPSPVPPYLRLVVPSACWKASKIRRLLLRGDADAGVLSRRSEMIDSPRPFVVMLEILHR